MACKSCAACDEIVDSVLHGIIVGKRDAQARRAKAVRRWQKVIRRAVHASHQSYDSTAADITTSERLKLLRMAIDGTHPPIHIHRRVGGGRQGDESSVLGRSDRNERLLNELRGWCREAGTEPGFPADDHDDGEPECLMEF